LRISGTFVAGVAGAVGVRQTPSQYFAGVAVRRMVNVFLGGDRGIGVGDHVGDGDQLVGIAP